MLKFSILTLLLLTLLSPLAAAPFAGWQGMRVMEQDGRPLVLKAIDLDGNGTEEMIVVNGQNSRLDIYHWGASADADSPESVVVDGVNDLPLAPEFRRHEVQLEHVPWDVVGHDLDGDHQPELIVLVSPPNRILVYGRDAQGKWQVRQKHNLSAGEIAPRDKPLLIRDMADGSHRLMISYKDGLQELKLQPGAQAEWLTPRDKRERRGWWLADFDGDGDQDLIEQCRESEESLRWYETAADGHLMSADVVHDLALQGATVIRETTGRARLLLIDGTASGLLRRYESKQGAEHVLGKRRSLSLLAGRKAVWCGLDLGTQKALVVADSERPRLLVYGLADAGWESERAYPAVGEILGMAAPSAQAGILLIWAKDAPDLLRCQWEQERLSYPRAWVQAADIDNRKILALGSVGTSTWWVQKVQNDLHLYIWDPQSKEPRTEKFAGIGAKTEEVLWIGGARLLVRETHSRNVKLASRQGDRTTVTEPSNLKQWSIGQCRLIAVGDQTPRLARLADGVLQWLGDDLQPTDQIMLPQGQKLIDFVQESPRSGWALQENGRILDGIDIDDNGVATVRESLLPLGGGAALVRDPVLGIVLVAQNRLLSMSPGPQRELQLLDVIDTRIARTAGVKEIGIHRVHTIDIDRDGHEEILVFDDARHRVTALGNDGGTLQPRISWPVFEDKKYPYDDESASLVQEPRVVVALDVDGDQQQDLAMLCHDRLVVYLAKDKSE